MSLYFFIRNAPACLVCLAIGLTGAATSASGDTLVRLRGSSTFLPLVRSVAEDYMGRHPGVAVVVAGGGSSRGYKAMLDGTADVAFTSGPIPEALQRESERRGLRLRFTTIGYRPLVVAVHPSQPMNDVTLAELRAIFTGRMSQWPSGHAQVPAPIQVLVGRPTSGVTLEWQDLVLNADDTFTPKAQVMTEQLRAQAVSTTPHGITYLPLGAPHAAKTKSLLIHGVAPTPANVLNRTYPLRAELVLVTHEKASAATAALVKAFSEPRPTWQLDGLIMAPARAASKP